MSSPHHNPHAPRTYPSPAEIDKVRSIRELFKGRFSDNGIAELLAYYHGDKRDTAGQLHKLRPDQNIDETDPELLSILTRLQNPLDDGSNWILVQSIKKGTINITHRLFACGPCNAEWWYKVPLRKQVSKCSLCKIKYDPIPRESEWGWAIFNCPCGNKFSGFGQMNKTYSKCYNCGENVPASEIKPPERRRGDKKTRNRHQCDAPDCCGAGRGARGGDTGVGRARGVDSGVAVLQPVGQVQLSHQQPHARRRDGEQGAWNQRCVHPTARRVQSGGNNPRPTVLMESNRHTSTGSTVDTFLKQDDTEAEKETIFAPPLSDIAEDGGSGGDGSLHGSDADGD